MNKDELLDIVDDHTSWFDDTNIIMDAVDEYCLSLVQKAIDDTFNQVHYSSLHPRVVPPIEHNTWRQKWIENNLDK